MLLEGMGHEVSPVSTAEAALEQLDKLQFDVAFLDLKLNGRSGMELLPQLLTRNPRLEVVVFTAFASFESAVEAMRCGASDYVPKPFTPDQIRQVLTKIADRRLQRLRHQAHRLRVARRPHLESLTLSRQESAGRQKRRARPDG